MKMLFTKAVLFLSLIALESKAQWIGTPPFLGTSDDVTIQSNTVQGNLTLQRSDIIQNMGGTTYTYPKPALSILQTRPYLTAAWMGGSGPTATNTPQNIFEIVASSYTNGSGGTSSGSFLGYSSPIFIIDEFGRMQVGGGQKSYYSNSIYGASYFDGHSLFKGKMRLTNNAATITTFDWSNTGFPFTFSVDNGKSRFMGNVEIQNSDFIVTNGNSKFVGNIDVVNGDISASNGNLTIKNGAIRVQNTNGTSNFRIDENGLLIARQVDVHLDPIPDYVFHAAFDNDSANHYIKNNFYSPITLLELETYVKENRHLPGIKSATEYQQQGSINIGELQLKLLQKVEELTLYNIELSKSVIEMKKKQIELELTISNLK
jgi:hypothetical protein